MEKKLELGANHPLEVTTDSDTGAIEPFVKLNNGLSAKISRAAFYRIAEHAVNKGGDFSVLSNGVWFKIG